MDIDRRILQLCEQRKITINKLAALSDLTQSTLNAIVSNPEKNPQINTIERICHGLDITLAEFFTEEIPDDLPWEAKQDLKKYEEYLRYKYLKTPPK